MGCVCTTDSRDCGTACTNRDKGILIYNPYLSELINHEQSSDYNNEGNQDNSFQVSFRLILQLILGKNSSQIGRVVESAHVYWSSKPNSYKLRENHRAHSKQQIQNVKIGKNFIMTKQVNFS